MKKLLVLILGAALLTGCGTANSKSGESVAGNTGENTDDVFVVGMECAYAPFNWQTSEKSEYSVSLGNTGYADGYDVQIAKKIADDLGQKLVIKKISWDGLIMALDAGEIDAVVAGMTASETREQGADFTSPYYDSKEMIMIVRKGSEEAGYQDIQQFKEKKIVGQKGTNYDDVIDQINGVQHMTPKTTYPEMVIALQQKDVDGITGEMAVAKGILAAHDDLEVVHFDEGKGFEADTTVAIAMKEGTRETELFRKVQKSIDSLSEEERSNIMMDVVERQPAGE